MDVISEARLAAIFPALASKIRLMDSMLRAEGIEIRVVQALRTWAEQDALYAQGRTVPGHIVTNCPGGKSYHNFGLSVDCVPSTRTPEQPYDPDWNNKHPSWIRMETIGKSLGLECGAFWRTFKDCPHFQMTGRFPIGEPSQELKDIFRDGGLEAVWKAVEESIAQ